MNLKKLRIKPYDSLIVIWSGAPAAMQIGHGLREQLSWRSFRPDHTVSPHRHRLLRRRLLGCAEQRQQRTLDRGLPRRRGDLGAKEISYVEHVDHALAEGRHMRGGDVEVELGERGG